MRLLVPGTAIVAYVCAVVGRSALASTGPIAAAVSPTQIGRASGVTNVGGFVSSLLVVALVGVLLDVQGAGSPAAWSTEVFRVAMAVHVPVLLVGLAGMWWSVRRMRRPDDEARSRSEVAASSG